MPLSKDHPILIVGAGTFGLSTAMHLSKSYRNITVLDRFDPPVEDAASTDINKVIRADYGSDLIYQALALESLEVFKVWNQTQLIYHQTGIMILDENDLDQQSYQNESFKSLVMAGQGDFLERNDDIDQDRFPSLKELRKEYPFGYFNKHGGWCDSSKAIKHVVNLLRESGNVTFKTGLAGTLAKLVEADGNVIGIEMKDGRYHYGLVILATGAWTPSLLPITKDLLVCNGQPVIEIHNVPKSEFESSPVWGIFGSVGYYGFPPNSDGIIKISRHSNGYINPVNGISTPLTVLTNPSKAGLIPRVAFENLQIFIKTYFPSLVGLDINLRMCYYTDSVDGDFLITKIPGQENLIVASGGSGHAFKFLPVIGRVVEDVVEGRQTEETRRFGWRTCRGYKEASRSGFGDNLSLADSDLISRSKL